MKSIKGADAMSNYHSLTQTELEREFSALRERYESLKSAGLQLNMARGKPGKEQLDLVNGILLTVLPDGEMSSDGNEVRNYGTLSGLPAAKRLFADILSCRPEQCFIGGNASLQLMYSVISAGYVSGLPHSPRPWCREEKIKWLCPAPGYDRHFRITESFGFELVTVPMLPDGPDMDAVERLVRDPSVKGIWCVPKFSNPDGIVYSGEVIERLAALKPAAPDFTLMWDNAYCVHEFACDFIPFPDMISLCAAHGNPDMVYEFASTSKITFPGAGISVLASSESNIAFFEKFAGVQIISFDKVNQLRHVRYLKNREETLKLMRRHAEILRPKFQCVLDKLENEIAPCGIASWQKPLGGYFVSVNTLPGLAKRTLELCREAGVVMTGAGAAFPYGKDPSDSNIRIAPTVPPAEELAAAMDIFCVSLKLAAVERFLK